jgi:hypothetical protein
MNIKHCVGESSKIDFMVTVRAKGIPGTRLRWGETETLENGAASWPKLLQTISQRHELDKRTFKQLKALSPLESKSVFIQKFLIFPYTGASHHQECAAMLSRKPQREDRVCFFMDSDIAAVIKPKDGLYSVACMCKTTMVLPLNWSQKYPCNHIHKLRLGHAASFLVW